MNITIDTANKTITINHQISYKELQEFIKKMELEDYQITGTSTFYVYPTIQPYYPNYFTYPIITCGGNTFDAVIKM